jgi:hypothetical protein
MDLKLKELRNYVVLIQIKIKSSYQLLRYIRNTNCNTNQLNDSGDYAYINICQLVVYVKHSSE